MPLLQSSRRRHFATTSSSCFVWSICWVAISLCFSPVAAWQTSIALSFGSTAAGSTGSRSTRHKPYFQSQKRWLASPALKSSSSSSSSSAGNNQDDDPVLRLPLMEAELALLRARRRDNDNNEEDDTLSMSSKLKELETAIGDAKTAAEFGVRKSQQDFYRAFSRGDLNAMEDVWSLDSHVRCVHPGMGSLEGREQVMASWEQIFTTAKSSSSSSEDDDDPKFPIEPVRSRVEICGLTAICSCVEKTDGGGELEALNIYKRENGSWRMTLHMAGPIVMQTRDRFFF